MSSDFDVSISSNKITVDYKGLRIEEVGSFGPFVREKIKIIKDILIQRYNDTLINK